MSSPSAGGSFDFPTRTASNYTSENTRRPPGDLRSTSTPDAVYLRNVRVETPSIFAANDADTIP